MTNDPRNREQEFASLWNEHWRLDPSQPTEVLFMRACDRAVALGVELSRLRTACREQGFMGVPLDLFLTEAAHAAKVSLPRLLEPLAQRAGNIWIGLARAVSLPLADSRLMVRAMFAQSAFPSPVGARFRRQAGPSPEAVLYQPDAAPTDYADMLAEAEKAYTGVQRRSLQAMLAALEP